MIERADGRTCGECTACCTTTRVIELQKPIDVRCPHLLGKDSCGSCGIYSDRPQACKVFTCAWLSGYGPDEHRPDRCGVVSEIAYLSGEPFLVFTAVAPGFRRHNRSVREANAFWRREGCAVFDGISLFATPEQQAKLHHVEFQFSDGKSIRTRFC